MEARAMTGIADHLDDLMQPTAWPHPVAGVQLVETHISWVFLTGDYAWKIKKPVDLGFVDFSTLAKRRFFCEEELRLNRRLAPQLYLSVDSLCLIDGHLHIGICDSVFDYAVRMRQFDPEQQLDRLLAHDGLRPSQVEQLARHIAQFHAEIAVADSGTEWGDAERVVAPMLENFTHIRQCHVDSKTMTLLDWLENWTQQTANTLRERLRQRKAEGFVRECHGDLHLANMVLLDDEVVAFDCLEFNPALRWIDVISEVAFTVMDLEDRGAPGLAARFLDTWLVYSGDYTAIGLLDFYKVYRAMVRAKVNAIRLQQASADGDARRIAQQDVVSYLELAQRYTRRRAPHIILTHGFSASGKSTVTTALLEAGQVVRIRSDVERKRLYGLSAEADSGSGTGSGIYSREATARTYARLLTLAEAVLDGGYSVILDAAFLLRAQREAVYALAGERHIACTVLAIDAPEAVLRERIMQRQDDVSEADLEVLEKQLHSAERLGEDEAHIPHVRIVHVDTTAALDSEGLWREAGLR